MGLELINGCLISVGLEFDSQNPNEAAQWRWYIGGAKGPWRKARRQAVTDLRHQLRLSPLLNWTWGSDRYCPRNRDSGPTSKS